MARDTRKTLKREKNEKRKVREKFKKDNKIINFFMEKDIFWSKT